MRRPPCSGRPRRETSVAADVTDDVAEGMREHSSTSGAGVVPDEYDGVRAFGIVHHGQCPGTATEEPSLGMQLLDQEVAVAAMAVSDYDFSRGVSRANPTHGSVRLTGHQSLCRLVLRVAGAELLARYDTGDALEVGRDEDTLIHHAVVLPAPTVEANSSKSSLVSCRKPTGQRDGRCVATRTSEETSVPQTERKPRSR